MTPRAVEEFARRLHDLGWVTDLLVGGSLATGDYRPGISDLGFTFMARGRHILVTFRLLTRPPRLSRRPLPRG